MVLFDQVSYVDKSMAWEALGSSLSNIYLVAKSVKFSSCHKTINQKNYWSFRSDKNRNWFLIHNFYSVVLMKRMFLGFECISHIVVDFLKS